MRATELPTCPRLILPKPASLRVETALQNIKDKMLDKIAEYKEKNCDSKGYTKSNLTESEMKGMQELRSKMNNKEIVVSKTDKTGELCVDTIENYSEAVKVHTENDRKVGWEEVQNIEKSMIDHLRFFNKMFSVGSNHDHELRVSQASTSSNCPPPTLDIFKEDSQEGAAWNGICWSPWQASLCCKCGTQLKVRPLSQ